MEGGWITQGEGGGMGNGYPLSPLRLPKDHAQRVIGPQPMPTYPLPLRARSRASEGTVSHNNTYVYSDTADKPMFTGVIGSRQYAEGCESG